MIMIFAAVVGVVFGWVTPPVSEILAQVDPTTAMANGFATNPLAWGLAIALVAVGFLFRELRIEQQKRIEAEREGANRMIETLKEMIPLANKLTECVELLDRAVERLTDGE